ncbi:hypothetical protein CQA53_04290 [Helicobacter didelphidarum]|uniref:Uncharacterized protein n=1 Tax=Helicobacter didelphidarum TaxID=2040648 RepID=A0A3D8ILT7_9HELI|nr:hypothetical protein [Helicobacter didelphidarum]RDU66237.1 hypothetical protein CQA53_04290 [Helicobacter didelphidarum]
MKHYINSCKMTHRFCDFYKITFTHKRNRKPYYQDCKKNPLCASIKYNAFISIYALLLSLSISLVALHTLRSFTLKKDISLALVFQKQSQLYAKSLKEIALRCLKEYDLQTCAEDSIKFDEYFNGEYKIINEIIRDNTHPNYQHNILLLDISIHAKTLLSTHPLRHAKRYIIKGYK